MYNITEYQFTQLSNMARYETSSLRDLVREIKTQQIANDEATTTTAIEATIVAAADSELDILKRNFLKEIAFHLQHCSTNCNVDIWKLFRLADRAGLKFTAEERSIVYEKAIRQY